MPPLLDRANQLAQLLASSPRPVYAVDQQRRIVYCNEALAQWLGVDQERIVGRFVEYHSEPTDDHTTGLLPGLCPPPAALAGEDASGSVSSLARGGNLLHRRARFFALEPKQEDSPGVCSGVLVLLADRDLTVTELANSLDQDPSVDALHRAIRQFRKEQGRQFAVDSLVGVSSAIGRVRTQVTTAAASGANVLVIGPPGSGRSHVARAIHHHGRRGDSGILLPVDCQVVRQDPLRHTLDSLRRAAGPASANTLLLEELDCLDGELQNLLVDALSTGKPFSRVLATARDVSAAILPEIVNVISTMTIELPRLRDRIEDLPLLAQCFLESCNKDNPKQVGSISGDALDLLNLYHWPGELDELREVIAAAHASCAGHEIARADLPLVVQQAAQIAAHPRKTVEKINLESFLASIEKELIQRALKQANGNKTGAAELLGMTRPRLYRRLLQHGIDQQSDPKESP